LGDHFILVALFFFLPVAWYVWGTGVEADKSTFIKSFAANRFLPHHHFGFEAAA
jgi:hypothetical protein